jgi:hypothetical protein
LNPNIFTEDFFAVETFGTDNADTLSPVVIQNMNSFTEISSNDSTPNRNNDGNNYDVPSTSLQCTATVSIKSITPIPQKLIPKVLRRKSAKQHFTELTSTSIKIKLELNEKKK